MVLEIEISSGKVAERVVVDPQREGRGSHGKRESTRNLEEL